MVIACCSMIINSLVSMVTEMKYAGACLVDFCDSLIVLCFTSFPLSPQLIVL